MKTKNIYIILILTILLLPFKVHATENVSLSIDCSELILNESKTCNLYATVKEDHQIKGFQGKVTGENVTFEEFKVSTSPSWTTSLVNENAIAIANGTGYSGRTKLGTIKIKATALESAKIKFMEVKYSIDSDELDSEAEPVEFTFTVKEATTTGSTPGDSGSSEEDGDDADDTPVKDSDCSLSSLSVENETLDPKFKSSVFEYEVYTNAKSITIKATANSSKAKISGIGKINVEDGKTYNVVVTAENGNKATYKIKVINKVTDTNKQNTKNEKSKEGNPDTGIISISILSVIMIALCSIIFVNRHKLNLFKKF